MSEAVRYEADKEIGVITLDRADNRNSMTPELLAAFAVASAISRAIARKQLKRHKQVFWQPEMI